MARAQPARQSQEDDDEGLLGRCYGLPLMSSCLGEHGQRAWKRYARRSQNATCSMMPSLRPAPSGIAVVGAGAAAGGTVWMVATRLATAMQFVPHVAGQIATPLAAVAAASAGLAVGLLADQEEEEDDGFGAPTRMRATPAQRRPWGATISIGASLRRLVDALKGVVAFGVVYYALPEAISEVSVWMEPLSASEVAHLLTGFRMDSLEHMPTGLEHAFVLLKTSKGQTFLTEKLHDGKVVVEDMGNGRVYGFQHGQQLPAEYTSVPDSFARFADGTSLFLRQDVPHGPSMLSMERFARAQSTIKYDLVRSNCQHYVADVYSMVSGKALQQLPNGTSLEVANSIFPATMPATVDEQSSLYDHLHWIGSQVGFRKGAAAAFLFLCPNRMSSPEVEAKRQEFGETIGTGASAEAVA